MDIKTRLEEEIIFEGKQQMISGLNQKGIFTIEDFTNCDIDQVIHSTKRKQFRALQKVLKYKYLETPLTVDHLLEKEYHDYPGHQIDIDAVYLGFGAGNLFCTIGREIYLENGSCKMIDIIKRLPINHQNLRDFYIEYYNSHIITPNLDATTDENSKDVLVALKNELTCLVKQRNELDEKISGLEQQISTLEGGTVTNGRS